MRERFDKQLTELNHQLIEMGALVENAIAMGTKSLMDYDLKLAEETIDNDKVINEREREIERICMKLLLRQQPMAKDLRFISSALKIITDMERIGDHAADICEIVLSMKGPVTDIRREHLQEMAEVTTRMVNMSIDSYVKMDLGLANQVIAMDDQVDKLFLTMRDDLVSLIHESRQNGEEALDLYMVSKYFEKIGDHAVNIAKWVVFSISGKRSRKKSSK